MKAFGPVLLLVIAVSLVQVPVVERDQVSERFRRLTRASQWRQTAGTRLKFDTHHPQGLVRIGECFYLSSVEVTVPTRRYSEPKDGLDRDEGQGRGHLFKFDREGNLLADILLGEGSIYHPGGIDYDGKHIWVPVAEYRPNSRSIIYRIDPEKLKSEEVFRFTDHIGGIVHDTADNSLHGVSWGSRWFYRWKINRNGVVIDAGAPPAKLRRLNPSFYIDYQDCKYLGNGEMLCSGLGTYQTAGPAGRFALGGLELVDLKKDRQVHQIPIEQRTGSGLPMTQNPFWIEPAGKGLRAYFLPEDRNSTLYVFEVGAPE